MEVNLYKPEELQKIGCIEWLFDQENKNPAKFFFQKYV